jgi:hypothetical protein
MKKIILFIIIFGGSAAGIAWAASKASNYMEEKTAAEKRADSLASEMVLAKTREDGWAAQLSTLQDIRELQDSTLDSLAIQLEAARGRIRTLTRLSVSAEGRIVDTVEVEVPGQIIPELFGNFDDGLLSARWRISSEGIFAMPYSIFIQEELIHSDMPDGRTLVTARALDDRVTLNVEDLILNPPVPVVIRQCSWGTRGKWFLAGASVIEGLHLIFGGNSSSVRIYDDDDDDDWR